MTILCLGGGTLGSVTPLLAVAEELQQRHKDLKIIWWGTARGPEKILVTAAGLNFLAWPSGKWRRYFSWQNFGDLFVIGYSFIKAWFYLGRLKPVVILTAGSFVAVPPAWAAWFRGLPVLAHQQDVRVGLANQLLKPVSTKFTLTLSKSATDFSNNQAVVTGNAVRSGFNQPPTVTEARQKLGLAVEKKVIVFLGGGTGAYFINQLVIDNLPSLTTLGQVVHLTGLGKTSTSQPAMDYWPIPLTADNLFVLQAADVVVSRAGLGTLSELAALKKPVVVVPMPGTHQEANAALLETAQAALVFKQTDLTSSKLIDTLSQLLNDSAVSFELGKNLSALIPTNGAKRIADEVEKVINRAKN
ncbi:UDP-N-acetylglucosamine--N-acetylmuramyl-(pentapeptide) pyrophosphoryl-undecaprenol N-acetylglucosamine transferase [Patescibacteria group bacterium]|nr:UDP-N-acetylglucosamine--N-acetylmuramyl-(pentapeptide) pyrophosphoryl-undecaprenol N-acetylglucosamine transferase [Patescibacteria group bacterium]